MLYAVIESFINTEIEGATVWKRDQWSRGHQVVWLNALKKKVSLVLKERNFKDESAAKLHNISLLEHTCEPKGF